MDDYDVSNNLFVKQLNFFPKDDITMVLHANNIMDTNLCIEIKNIVIRTRKAFDVLDVKQIVSIGSRVVFYNQDSNEKEWIYVQVWIRNCQILPE